jgi:LuxR family transcriptional regulator
MSREAGMVPNIVEITNRFAALNSIEELWATHLPLMAAFGFDRAFYASTSFRISEGVGDFRDALILTNHPRDYTDTYIDQELFRDAPTVRWAVHHVGVRSWAEFASDAHAGVMSKAELRVVAFNQRHGVTSGYAISFPKTNARACHGIGLSSSSMSQPEIDALWTRRGAEIVAINNVMHLKLCTLPRPGRRRLSPKQRAVLELMADGKTVQDAALVLGRNVATVEKHLRNVREAMDAETTAQAVLKATVQNQLFLMGELDSEALKG